MLLGIMDMLLRFKSVFKNVFNFILYLIFIYTLTGLIYIMGYSIDYIISNYIVGTMFSNVLFNIFIFIHQLAFGFIIVGLLYGFIYLVVDITNNYIVSIKLKNQLNEDLIKTIGKVNEYIDKQCKSDDKELKENILKMINKVIDVADKHMKPERIFGGF
jgi:hypothetical protein